MKSLANQNFRLLYVVIICLSLILSSCGQGGGNAPGELPSTGSPGTPGTPGAPGASGPFKNCAAILANNSMSASGVYSISYDGSGSPATTMNVYCDMTTNGGGWTLVMKQKSNDGTTLQGDTAYFTSSSTAPLNDNSVNLGVNDENLVSAAFTTVAGSALMLKAGNEATFKTQIVATGTTAFAAFVSPVTYSDDINGVRPDWFVHATAYPNGTAITGSRFGFNVREAPGVSSSNYYCAVRWGWVANENPSGTSPGTHDSCGGLGAYGSQYGSSYMSGSKSVWQPATLLLYIK